MLQPVKPRTEQPRRAQVGEEGKPQPFLSHCGQVAALGFPKDDKGQTPAWLVTGAIAANRTAKIQPRHWLGDLGKTKWRGSVHCMTSGQPCVHYRPWLPS